MRAIEMRYRRSGWGEGVSVAGMSILRLSVVVGVGWFERNNKASPGLQKQKFEVWIRTKCSAFFWFLWLFFDINQCPQPSIVALARNSSDDSVGDRTLSLWRGPIAARHDSLNMLRRRSH